MTPDKREHDPLEDFFRASADAPAEADAALLARIVADADAEQARFMARAPAAPAGGGLRARIAGWLAPAPAAWAGVMAASLCLGLWVGYTDAGQLSDLAGGYLGAATTTAADDVYSALLALDLEG